MKTYVEQPVILVALPLVPSKCFLIRRSLKCKQSVNRHSINSALDLVLDMQAIVKHLGTDC